MGAFCKIVSIVKRKRISNAILKVNCFYVIKSILLLIYDLHDIGDITFKRLAYFQRDIGIEVFTGRKAIFYLVQHFTFFIIIVAAWARVVTPFVKSFLSVVPEVIPFCIARFIALDAHVAVFNPSEYSFVNVYVVRLVLYPLYFFYAKSISANLSRVTSALGQALIESVQSTSVVGGLHRFDCRAFLVAEV